MKTLITALLVMAGSVLLALAVKEDNGYILIGYGQWTLEGSLAFFLLLNLLLFGALYLFLRLLARIRAVPRQLHDWQDQQGAKRARKALTQGLVELSEGHWKRAERNLIRHAGRSDTPLLNYLAAARSAQQQGAHDRRDHYLQLAHESMPSADVAVGLTQAELQLAHEQQEQALATLQRLRQIAPHHTHVLKLLKDLYQRVGDWQELNRLLPELKKRKVVSREELAALELRIFRNFLDQAAKHDDSVALDQAWKGLPAPVRENRDLLMLYTHHLMLRGEQERVEVLLKGRINRKWSDRLVELYGRVSTKAGGRQLAAAEGWLNGQPRNPVLLLALGRLSMNNQLWGKARSYLEASIGAGPSAPAYRELGALLEGMGEQEQARACFKAGLELVSDTPLPRLPDLLGHAGQQETPRGLESATDINPPKLEVVGEVKKG